MSVDPALAWTIRLVAAAVLATAAVAKLMALEPFVGVVRNYRLLPSAVVRPFAYLLPPLELVLALALVALPGAWLPPLGSALLLVGFAAAMGVNLRRGRIDIDCGCFAGLMRQKLSWPLVARNLVLALALLVVTAGVGGARPLAWLDIVTVPAGTASLLLAWTVVGSLYGMAPRLGPAGAR
jgi:Methylamine utilisation protein MauE